MCYYEYLILEMRQTYQCEISNAGDDLSAWDFQSSMTFPWLLMIFQSSMTFHDFSRKFYFSRFSRFSRPCGNPERRMQLRATPLYGYDNETTYKTVMSLCFNLKIRLYLCLLVNETKNPQHLDCGRSICSCHCSAVCSIKLYMSCCCHCSAVCSIKLYITLGTLMTSAAADVISHNGRKTGRFKARRFC